MRNLIWFVAGAIALAVLVIGGGLIFLKTGANGFSARAQPSSIERFAARQARVTASPAGARGARIPLQIRRKSWRTHAHTGPTIVLLVTRTMAAAVPRWGNTCIRLLPTCARRARKI